MILSVLLSASHIQYPIWLHAAIFINWSYKPEHICGPSSVHSLIILRGLCNLNRKHAPHAECILLLKPLPKFLINNYQILRLTLIAFLKYWYPITRRRKLKKKKSLIFYGKYEEKRPLGITKDKWGIVPKQIFKETVCEGIYWIKLAQGSAQKRGLIKIVMNPQVP